jgi:hypothetical protein
MTTPSGAKIKFDSTINLGHILTFLGFIGAGAVMWGTVDKRVVVLEEARSSQRLVDQRQDIEAADNKKNVREDLKEISNKLDRLIERPK